MPFPWISEEALRFDRFMAAALHDPERGYYARRIRGVGRGGDFTTAPMLSPALGRSIAAWAVRAMRETGCRDLIELGPGEGSLASTVRSALPLWMRLRTRFHLVESSGPLRQKQQALLGSRVRWHRTVEEALDACRGRACLYSNEFADAFPVRRFRREDARWSELHLAPGDPPREIWLETADLPPSSVFRISHPPGQIVEVHDSFRQWWSGWLPRWTAGRMLTIDYGDTAEHLYHRRPHGTLRAYLFQQRLEGPAVYRNPGRQDLTADVNFTDLAEWPAAYAEDGSCRTQRDFLLPHAPPGDPMLDPHGPGGAFKVIEHWSK